MNHPGFSAYIEEFQEGEQMVLNPSRRNIYQQIIIYKTLSSEGIANFCVMIAYIIGLEKFFILC